MTSGTFRWKMRKKVRNTWYYFTTQIFNQLIEPFHFILQSEQSIILMESLPGHEPCKRPHVPCRVLIAHGLCLWLGKSLRYENKVFSLLPLTDQNAPFISTYRGWQTTFWHFSINFSLCSSDTIMDLAEVGLVDQVYCAAKCLCLLVTNLRKPTLQLK